MESLIVDKILQQEWFKRPVLEVAPELVGKMLCRQLPDGKVVRLTINEVEAYNGIEDKACHASKGLTPRTEVMFGPAGHYYIYLCYGIHWLLNIVTSEEGYPAAVLIRGAGPFDGPGKLTKALKVSGGLNRMPVSENDSLWVEDTLEIVTLKVKCSPRVGIDYAGEPWVSKKWRWHL